MSNIMIFSAYFCCSNQWIVFRSAGGALGFCPDDGSGKKEVYVVENMDLKPVDDSAGGKLFGGDSYVIKYTYEEGGIEKHIIYFWQASGLEFSKCLLERKLIPE